MKNATYGIGIGILATFFVLGLLADFDVLPSRDLFRLIGGVLSWALVLLALGYLIYLAYLNNPEATMMVAFLWVAIVVVIFQENWISYAAALTWAGVVMIGSTFWKEMPAI